MLLAVVPVTSLRLWLVLLVGMLVLTPLTYGRHRRWALLAVNALFLALCVGASAVWVLLGVSMLWIVLRALHAKQWPFTLATLTLVGILALFVLHKRPELAAWARLTPLNPLLAGIGFSYVCLRVIDVFQAIRTGRYAPPDLVGLINYVLPFHMLAAGPIQAYDDYAKQPDVPEPLTRRDALDAADRIAQGLFKKFVLAFLLRKLLCTGWQGDGWYVVLEMNAHFLWLYLDFAAYSDLAVGFGKLLGVPTPENFNRPYLARNLTEFWDRWHMSFTQFLRRNLFVPLQMTFMRRTGGQHALLSACVAIAITFVLCGAWHGLTAPFLLFGALHALGMVAGTVYKELLRRRLGAAGMKRYVALTPVRVVGILLTFEYVAFTTMWMNDQWTAPW